MEVIHDIETMRNFTENLRREGKIIGFTPTMGALHEGHMRLIETSKKENDVTIISIFVNPIQFDREEDYKTYPRNFIDDRNKAQQLGVDAIFYPTEEIMYHKPFYTYVDVEYLSETLCGKYRPGHFRGVCTVVVKLFNIIRPHRAYFGQKDYQQATIIKALIRDLNFDIELRILPTVRTPDGLALSSRNIHLTEKMYQAATSIYKSLQVAKELLDSGERQPERIINKIKAVLDEDLKIEYIELVDPDTLHSVAQVCGSVLVAVAVWAGNVRLIDNLLWKEPIYFDR